MGVCRLGACASQGIVQTVEPISQGCGVSVTIASYSTPLGNNINKKGIEPDIPVKCEPTTPAVDCLPSV
jgi:C-terminal processing protease CtpA/Prc